MADRERRLHRPFRYHNSESSLADRQRLCYSYLSLISISEAAVPSHCPVWQIPAMLYNDRHKSAPASVDVRKGTHPQEPVVSGWKSTPSQIYSTPQVNLVLKTGVSVVYSAE